MIKVGFLALATAVGMSSITVVGSADLPKPIDYA